MVGGNQLKSRRSKLRTMLNEKVCLGVRSNNWDDTNTHILNGILEFRKPDKGYFLKNTDAKIILPHVKSIDLDLNYINMDLSNSSRIQERYVEVQR